MIYSEPIELIGTSGYVQIDIPFAASYCAVMNQTTPATLYFATGKVGVKPAGAIPISSGQNLSFDILKTQSATIFFEGNSGDNNPTIQFSDMPLSMSSSNSQVNIVNGVTLAPGSGVSINGTPTVKLDGASTVQISGTPNVSVTNQQINTIVGNSQAEPVPTIPQTYYGTGVDGAFSPTSNYTFQNVANQADIRNFTGVTIPSGVTVNFANPAHYICWFVEGNVSINGTIQCANATANVVSSQPKLTLFNGSITVPIGGTGGNGGKGGSTGVAGGNGGTGGTASPYGSGSGAGGGGGASTSYAGVNGANGTNGSGTSQGGNVGSIVVAGSGGTNGQNASSSGVSTLIIVASGSITINGTILGNGSAGGQGGSGESLTAAGIGAGGGGGAGSGYGGNGGNGGNGATNAYPNGGCGGGGGGGQGGASILLYSGSSVTISGTVNVNGGAGGNGGAAGTGSNINGNPGNNGTNGQGGTLVIYQYNNQISG